MKSFMNWLRESYAPRNLNWLLVRNYLKNAEKNFDVLDSWEQFKNWDESEEIANNLSLDLEDEDKLYDNAAKINKYMMDNPELLDNFLYQYLDSEESPAYLNMNYIRDLPPNTWLVHFSDKAGNIADDGFKHGVSDVRKMHYTRGETYSSRTSDSGYNFAFLANSKEAASAAKDSKYGSDAVMFMSAGVLTYHAGDNEDQVVFDGTNVKPKDIVYLERTAYDWVVKSKDSNKRDPYINNDFGEVVKWVMNNWQQYRKIIMG